MSEQKVVPLVVAADDAISAYYDRKQREAAIAWGKVSAHRAKEPKKDGRGFLTPEWCEWQDEMVRLEEAAWDAGNTGD